MDQVNKALFNRTRLQTLISKIWTFMNKSKLWTLTNSKTFRMLKISLDHRELQEIFTITIQTKCQALALETQLKQWLQEWQQWHWETGDLNKCQYTAACMENSWTSSVSIAGRAFALIASTLSTSSTDSISFNPSWWTTLKISTSSKAKPASFTFSGKTSMTSLTEISKPRSGMKFSISRSRVLRQLKTRAQGSCSWSTRERWVTLRKKWKFTRTSSTTKSSISSKGFSRLLRMVNRHSNPAWSMPWIRNSFRLSTATPVYQGIKYNTFQ